MINEVKNTDYAFIQGRKNALLKFSKALAGIIMQKIMLLFFIFVKIKWNHAFSWKFQIKKIIPCRSLHNPCNILIALHAFFISFLILGYSIKFFVFLFGLNYISLRHCYYVQCVPLAGAILGGQLQLCVGIDRLFGISLPIW